MKEHRICALCKHLEVVETGREFPAIADTEYAVFRCRIFALHGGFRPHKAFTFAATPLLRLFIALHGGFGQR